MTERQKLPSKTRRDSFFKPIKPKETIFLSSFYENITLGKEGHIAFKGKVKKINGPEQLKTAQTLLSKKKKVLNNSLMKELYGDRVPKVSKKTAIDRIQAIVPQLNHNLSDVGLTIASEWRPSKKGRKKVWYYFAEKPVSADQSSQGNKEKKYSIRYVGATFGRKHHDGYWSKKIREIARDLGINVSANWPEFTKEEVKKISETLKLKPELNDLETCALATILNANYGKKILSDFKIPLGAKTFDISVMLTDFYYKGIKYSSSNREGDVVSTLFKKLIHLGQYKHRAKYIKEYSKPAQFLLSITDGLNKEKFRSFITKLKNGFKENIKHAETKGK